MPSIHPVAQLLCQRCNENSLPGTRTDGYRVGLAIEGGGMRGIVSAAMMTALADHNLLNSFDAFYAFSAGALNCAYFLSGLSWYALSVYYDTGVSPLFFDARRLLKHQSVMSIDYIIDIVMETLKPLDYQAVLASSIELHVAVTSISEIKPRIFTRFTSKEELKTIFKASACLPLAVRSPITYNGDSFLDGGVLLAHPVLTALEDGCTHILVIRTRATNISRAALWSGQHLMAQYLQHLRPGLGTAYLNTTKQYRQLQCSLKEANRCQEGPPFLLDVVSTDGSHQVTTFSQNQGVLFQGIRAGYRAMMEAIGGTSEQVYLRPALFEDLQKP
jgi:predicted patatin/cPLA2 family phospholipase